MDVDGDRQLIMGEGIQFPTSATSWWDGAARCACTRSKRYHPVGRMFA